MGFKSLSEEKIEKIVELGKQGLDVTSIAAEAGVSEGSVKKYLLKVKIKPKWTVQPIQTQTAPVSYAAPSQVPGKLESRSALSGDADYGRDELRILQSTIERHRLESSLKSLSDQQPAMNVTDLLRAMGEMRQQDAPGVSAMADEIRQLRDDNIKLNQNLAEARSEVAMKDMETRLRQEMGALASRMKSDRIEELTFWKNALAESPEIVGAIIDRTSGQIIERASRVGEAAGIKVGGIIGEPRPIRAITTPGRRPGAVEVPYSDDELCELSERLGQEVLSEDADQPEEPANRDLGRESDLARELAKSRKIIAERDAEIEKLKNSPKPLKSKVIEATPSKSKVITATEVLSASENEVITGDV